MALQGTLDTFELPDVLRLLASTRKTGRLHLRGDRGDGDVWLADGQVVGVATSASGGDLGDGMFELLRAHEGAFSFEPGETPAAPVPPADVEPLLAAAEAQLTEWREIEAVVPSVDAWVTLAPELAGPEVTIDAGTWRLVATIGGGLTVAELGHALGLGEVAVSRIVRDVVMLGIGSVAAAPAHARPEPAPVAAAPVETASYESTPYEPTPYEPQYTTSYEPAPEPSSPLFTPFDAEPPQPRPASPFDLALERVEDPDEADEVARQLAMLSPRAAQAIAAAAASDNEADRQAAIDAAVDDADEPVNRGLLLKFLSSVK